MRLVHFSDTPVSKVLSAQQFLSFADVRDGTPLGKPTGFWVSDEDDHGWSAWCKAEDFRNTDEQYQYEVTIKPEAKILHIETPAELMAFTEQSYSRHSELNKGKYGHFIHEIDWRALAKVYQGIIITPYQWSLRLEPRYFWYYGWDCASGCIWDPEAIESLKLVAMPIKIKEAA